MPFNRILRCISRNVLHLFVYVMIYIHVCSVQPVDGSYSILSNIKPEEIAIVQYDSRKPLSDYWLAAAQWNKYYCDKHGHVFIYYTSKYETEEDLEWCEKDVLASPWCKVKAMVQADRDFPNIKIFLYMDSDAVVDKRFENKNINTLLMTMYHNLHWDVEKKPLVFNQDGPCWWCRLVEKVGYTMCLNAGTVMWYRHPVSSKLLAEWWNAAMDPYETNPIRRRFRIKWPWEQDRQMAVYNRSSEFIQVASQPEKATMDMRAGHHNWCLSHLPESGCFVSHYCAYKSSKPKLIQKYVPPETYNKRITAGNPFGFEVHKLQ